MAINPNIKDNSPRAMAEVSKNFQEIKNKEKVDLRKDDAGTPRILIGRQEGGFGTLDYGFKISQDGVDVRSATDDQLVMSSAFNTFKVVEAGTATVSLPNPVTHYSLNTTVVTHSLGYKPAYLVYVEAPAGLGGNLHQIPYTGFDTSGNFGISFDALTDTNTITFRVQPGTASAYDGTNWIFKYYLLRETAN